MKSHSFVFDNGRGYSLAARFDEPDGERYAVALFAHCFTCDKNLNAVRRIAAELVRRGIAVFSFDFTGLGGSEGEFAEGHFSSQARDIMAAAAYLERQYGVGADFLVGHSLGGTACLYVARNLPKIRGVVTIGSPFDPEHITHLFDADVARVVERGESAEVCISGRPFRVNAEFIRDFRSHPPAEWIGEVRQEVLLLHSPVDRIVGIEHAEKLFVSLRHPKSYISLGGADHMLSRREDAHVAASVIAGWAEKFFHRQEEAANGAATTSEAAMAKATASGATAATASEAVAETAPATKAEGLAQAMGCFPAGTAAPPCSDHQVVAEIGTLPFVTRVGVGNKHYLLGDEPILMGGTDNAPTPFGYLLTALAMCTVMTLQVYSRRKGITLTRAVAHCDYRKEPAPHIDRLIEVEGEITDKQRRRLVDIANKCPLHRLLKSGVEVSTTLLREGEDG